MTTPNTPKKLPAARLAAVRDLLVATYTDVGDGEHTTFAEAHDSDESAIYALAILDRTEHRGVIWAAFDDLATVDHNFDLDDDDDDSGLYWVLDALTRQWEHVADLLEPVDYTTALRVRVAASRLSRALARHRDQWLLDGDGARMSDLLAVAGLEWSKIDYSFEYALAERDGSGSAWLAKNAAAVEWDMGVLAGLRQDLIERGEIDPETGSILHSPEFAQFDTTHDEDES